MARASRLYLANSAVTNLLVAIGTCVKMVRSASFGFNKSFLSSFKMIWMERQNRALKRRLNGRLRPGGSGGRLHSLNHLVANFVIESVKPPNNLGARERRWQIRNVRAAKLFNTSPCDLTS